MCVSQVRMGGLFILARGRYLAEHQLYVVMAVVLNFHAKTELETPQSGAGYDTLGVCIVELYLFYASCA